MTHVHAIMAQAVPDLPTASGTNGWRIGNGIDAWARLDADLRLATPMPQQG